MRERDKAKSLIITLLTKGVFSGVASTEEIKNTAKSHGISWSTMERAKADLKINTVKDRTTPEGKWFWELP